MALYEEEKGNREVYCNAEVNKECVVPEASLASVVNHLQQKTK